MQIQHEVRKGSHGLGLFCMEDVKKGSITWKANPQENVQLFSASDFQLILDTHCSAFVDRLMEVRCLCMSVSLCVCVHTQTR